MIENLDLNEIAEEFNKEVITVVMESMVKKGQEISEGIHLSPKTNEIQFFLLSA